MGGGAAGRRRARASSHALQAPSEVRVELLDADAAHEALRTGKVAIVVVPPAPTRRAPIASIRRAPRAGWRAPSSTTCCSAPTAASDPDRRRRRAGDRAGLALHRLSHPGPARHQPHVAGHVGHRLRHRRDAHAQADQAPAGDADAQARLPALVRAPCARCSCSASCRCSLGFALLRRSTSACAARCCCCSPCATLGSLTFAGLGLLVASRAQNTQTAGGLINLVQMPMFMLSGVFFSSERFPDAMQPVIRALPLTALNDALRAVMIDGAGLAAVARPMAIMAAWGLASFAARAQALPLALTKRALQFAPDARRRPGRGDDPRPRAHLSPAQPARSTLAVVDGKIAYVGDDEAAARRAAGADAELIDAGGRTVVPGFNDAHVHFGLSVTARRLARHRRARAAEEAWLAAVSDGARGRAAGDWLFVTTPTCPTASPAPPISTSSAARCSSSPRAAALLNHRAMALATSPTRRRRTASSAAASCAAALDRAVKALPLRVLLDGARELLGRAGARSASPRRSSSRRAARSVRAAAPRRRADRARALRAASATASTTRLYHSDWTGPAPEWVRVDGVKYFHDDWARMTRFELQQHLRRASPRPAAASCCTCCRATRSTRSSTRSSAVAPRTPDKARAVPRRSRRRGHAGRGRAAGRLGIIVCSNPSMLPEWRTEHAFPMRTLARRRRAHLHRHRLARPPHAGAPARAAGVDAARRHPRRLRHGRAHRRGRGARGVHRRQRRRRGHGGRRRARSCRACSPTSWCCRPIRRRRRRRSSATIEVLLTMVGGRVVYRRGGFGAPPPASIGAPRPPPPATHRPAAIRREPSPHKPLTPRRNAVKTFPISPIRDLAVGGHVVQVRRCALRPRLVFSSCSAIAGSAAVTRRTADRAPLRRRHRAGRRAVRRRQQVAGDGCETDCTMTPATGPVERPGRHRVRARDRIPPLASGICQVTAGATAQLITGDTCSRRARCCAAARCSSTRPASSRASAATASATRPPAARPRSPARPASSRPASSTRTITSPTPEPPVRRHRRALRAAPRVAQGPARPHQDPVARRRHRRRSCSGASCASSWAARPRRSARAATPGLLRNLDDAADAGGLVAKPAVDFDTFPLGDSSARSSRAAAPTRRSPSLEHRSPSDRRLRAAHLRGHRRRRAQRVPLPLGAPAAAHDITAPQSAFIHAVGLARRRLRDDGADAHVAHLVAALEHPLYGNTAQVTVARAPRRQHRARHRLDCRRAR